ncbi:MAG: SpoIIIAH-like family protein [Clostridiales bacterium]|nr:SpoIIIAH-like family protein [Clostridiales bacterium]
MVLKKKNVIIAGLVVALGAAVFVNWYYTKPNVTATSAIGESSDKQTINNLGDAQYVSSTITGDSVQTQAAAENEFFAKTRLARQTSHDEACEKLNDVVNSADADEKSKNEAINALAQLAKTIKLEGDTENLITAKISSDNIVIINDSKATVVVNQGVLNDTVALQIKDIVIKQTGFTSDNISISEAK